ncbi:unnamed protein product [Meloidogyne enterolobii]|uniref:Uncharacterized protein n=1 Tax=Meloidogyne enterolobii TaxID=390850 RepID=A0ACB1AAB8_MELEN
MIFKNFVLQEFVWVIFSWVIFVLNLLYYLDILYCFLDVLVNNLFGFKLIVILIYLDVLEKKLRSLWINVFSLDYG